MRSTLALLAVAAPAVLAAAPGGCSGLELVYARATTEPAASDTSAKNWSKGYGAAGYSLLTNITALVPGATGYPVNYPAAMGTEDKGMADMVRHINERAKACPDQKYVIGGHSQGSFAVQLAIPKFSPEILNRIVAVTHFGGKPCLPAVENRCMSYCNKGDPVCSSYKCVLPPKKRDILERRELLAKLPECAATFQMKSCGLGSGSHFGYNNDGTYVKAAACFAAAQYQKTLGGAKSAGAE